MTKVKSKDAVKLATVRATAFDPAATEGGSGTVDKIDGEP